jgi:hypothetical protein
MQSPFGARISPAGDGGSALDSNHLSYLATSSTCVRLDAAYEGFTLALAEGLQCELWTADRRLVQAAGLPWVRLAGVWQSPVATGGIDAETGSDHVGSPLRVSAHTWGWIRGDCFPSTAQ